MVSDSEIVEKLQEFLQKSDLNTTTASTIRRQLEQHFAVDLSDRKPFIREQIDLFLNTQAPQSQNDDVFEEQGGVVEEEEKEEDEEGDNGNEEIKEEAESEEQEER